MKKILLSAFALAIISATPAYAQSSFVMVIGDAPRAEKASTNEPETREVAIQRIVDEACVRPFARDLKAQEVYRECVAEVREQLNARETIPQQIALR